jgi:hypothetical protein
VWHDVIVAALANVLNVETARSMSWRRAGRERGHSDCWQELLGAEKEAIEAPLKN